jgi:hypothetical protein
MHVGCSLLKCYKIQSTQQHATQQRQRRQTLPLSGSRASTKQPLSFYPPLAHLEFRRGICEVVHVQRRRHDEPRVRLAGRHILQLGGLKYVAAVKAEGRSKQMGDIGGQTKVRRCGFYSRTSPIASRGPFLSYSSLLSLSRI